MIQEVQNLGLLHNSQLLQFNLRMKIYYLWKLLKEKFCRFLRKKIVKNSKIRLFSPTCEYVTWFLPIRSAATINVGAGQYISNRVAITILPMMPPSLAATMDIATPVALENSVFQNVSNLNTTFNDSVMIVAPKNTHFWG